MTDQDSGDEGTLSLEQPKELCLHSLDGSGDIAQPGEAVTPGPECQPESNPAAGDERDVVAGQATEAVADVGGMNEGPNRPGAGDGPTGSSPQWVAALADVPAIGDPGRQREVVPVPGALTVGVPDTELDFWSMGPFELRACSSRGMSHRYAGVPRQDSFCVGSDNECSPWRTGFRKVAILRLRRKPRRGRRASLSSKPPHLRRTGAGSTTSTGR